jgi:Gluconate 2-dehydrogenase subunit 3
MSEHDLIGRRDAILRVSALLGGVAFVGGSALLDACAKTERRAAAADTAAAGGRVGDFTPSDIALLDEVADTILPDTPKSPGAKAAKVGPFMAVMVNDTYAPADQQIFRAGMTKIDDESRKSNGTTFMKARPKQRLALLERLDREQKAYMDARDAAQRKKSGKAADAFVPDQRKENAPAPDANAAPAITGDSPNHYFRMMKELTLLGYFTSEIGCTQAQRYTESPGRFDPCLPYKKGERAWAPHA